jgi:hypothetical protein
MEMKKKAKKGKKKQSKPRKKSKNPVSVKKTPAKKTAKKKLVPATKTHEELSALRISAKAASGASGTVVACWFKDPGGADQCIPMDSTACKNAGGVPRPGNCPN